MASSNPEHEKDKHRMAKTCVRPDTAGLEKLTEEMSSPGNITQGNEGISSRSGESLQETFAGLSMRTDMEEIKRMMVSMQTEETSSNSTESRSSRKRDVECHNCGKSGHMKGECREFRESKSTKKVECTSIEAVMKNCVWSSREASCTKRTVPILIGGIQTFALFFPVSKLCMIESTLVGEWGLVKNPYSVEVSFTDGRRKERREVVDFYFEVGGVKMRQEMFVHDNLPRPVILGEDWCKKWTVHMLFNPTGISILPRGGRKRVNVLAISTDEKTHYLPKFEDMKFEEDVDTKQADHPPVARHVLANNIHPKEIEGLPPWAKNEGNSQHPGLVRTALPDGAPQGKVEHTIRLGSESADVPRVEERRRRRRRNKKAG
eukprot:GHVS01057442.1.p1 GENE.GHVS01057442.1~~GHVS01057442.1.p1  ORF type:complete len:376 (+),score=20.95 GHVS01057442.1:170-1297(+)